MASIVAIGLERYLAFRESATCSIESSPRMAMDVQWNEIFFLSLRRFATFKTAFVSSVQRIWLATFKLRLNSKLSIRCVHIKARNSLIIKNTNCISYKEGGLPCSGNPRTRVYALPLRYHSQQVFVLEFCYFQAHSPLLPHLPVHVLISLIITSKTLRFDT